MKPFKFFRKDYVIFNLNVMNNLFGRIPSRSIIIEPDDYTISYTFDGTVGELFDRYPGVTICVVGIIIQRGGNRAIEVNHNNVDDINRQGLVFEPEDRIVVRYKPSERL
jgi:hypothetical protein